jgi:DNA-binding response OmpR family regulator
MTLLIIAEYKFIALFLAKGLKYENIQCDAKSFQDKWDDNYFLSKYDGIICKFTKNFKINNNQQIIKKIKDLSKKYQFFLLVDKDLMQTIGKKLNFSVIYYPDSISIRFFAHEIKKFLSYKIGQDINFKLKVADLTLYYHTREAVRFNKRHYLRNKEFKLLEFLMQNTDKILTRKEILENVWDRNATIFTNTLEVHINTLRRKIDYNPSKRLIETVYCEGYRMLSKPKNIN